VRIGFESIRWIPMLNSFQPTEIVALLALGMVSDGHPESVEFRTEDMVELSGLSRITFYKCLRELEKRDVIRVMERRSGAKGTTTVSINNRWLMVGG